MKNNLRRTIAVLKLFKENAFYSVSFTECDVRLQGKYSSDTVKTALSVRFTGVVDKSGYVLLTRGLYTIVLEA